MNFILFDFSYFYQGFALVHIRALGLEPNSFRDPPREQTFLLSFLRELMLRYFSTIQLRYNLSSLIQFLVTVHFTSLHYTLLSILAEASCHPGSTALRSSFFMICIFA